MSEFIKSQNVGFYIVFLMASFGTHFIDASRDLALHKNSKQSSTHKRYEAGRAVDGVLGIDVTDGHCSHTGLYHRQAWWEVDLGHIYRIQTINITYRRSRTDHLKGYSLYVANNRSMTMPDGFINEQLGYLCYHDADSTIPTYNQSRPCHVDGRYVVFYNNRKNEDAFVELCGIQVYGCPTGKFGFMCSDTCHCQSSGCNPDTGECDVDGCQTGWMGLSCSLRCHCNSGGACNIDTGACSGGCQSGWSGRSCAVWQYDLAHHKSTRQSTTYINCTSDKAIDGVITADVFPNGSCSHTDPNGRPEAWWEVDLGEVKRIQTINIIYRQFYTFRMSGFYLYISNSSYNNSQELSRDYLCYHDHGPGLPSYIQSLWCSVSGRYVIFYNKRPADYEPLNVKYYSERNATIELCEVQVIGVCDPGKFGKDCSQTCHCVTSDCNKLTGSCLILGCSAGWAGKACDQVCSHGHFGPDCRRMCHCNIGECNRIDGTCNISGCVSGWSGVACDTDCDLDRFGENCIHKCHCKEEGCDNANGKCKVTGCMDGWKGTSCDQSCDLTHYGPDCRHECHCNISGCSNINGTCQTLGCTKGWTGPSCNIAQDKTSCQENSQHDTEVSTGYALLGTFLAVSTGCNVGFVIYCFRMRSRSQRSPKAIKELQTFSKSDHESTYEGLDVTKVDTTRNVYDTLARPE